ncbi:MAG: Gfo/Idh/MocA family oxidoreductase [Chloroflexi bacterium]|nr:Gfo/Idh/MocA family oxidoreductase [Chloroflexota bacterium]
MAQQKVRVGIVGANVRYGWGTRAHIPALLSLPEYELVAVCTTRRDTAEESARTYGARHAFTDYNELVAHPDVDLVTVAVRVPLHHRVAMAALSAGKHVYCEWPLGANLEEAQAMASLAQKKGVRHMVGLQARASPALLRLKELLKEGYAGEVLAVNMTMFLAGILQRTSQNAWMADPAQGANTLTISAGHALDALCFCLGEFREVSAEVSAQVKEWRLTDTKAAVPVASPDNLVASGLLTGGAVASVHVATIPWHGSGWRLEVYGREGTLVASGQQMVQYADIRLQGARQVEKALEDQPVPGRLTWVPAAVPAGPPFNVAQMYRRLARAIHDEEDVEPNFGTALVRHRLLNTIQRASEQGQRLFPDSETGKTRRP